MTKPKFFVLAKPEDYIYSGEGYFFNPLALHAPENGNPTIDPIQGAEEYNNYIHRLINNEIPTKEYTLETLLEMVYTTNNDTSFIAANHIIDLATTKDIAKKYIITINIDKDKRLDNKIRLALLVFSNAIADLPTSTIINLQNIVKNWNNERKETI